MTLLEPPSDEVMKWVIIDEKGWRLKKDTPEHIRKEYEEWEKQLVMAKEG